MHLATLQRAGKVRAPRHVRRSARTRGRRAWQRCLTGGLRPAVRLLWVLGRALAPYEAPTHSVGLLCSFPPPRSFGRVRRSPGAPADRAGPLSMCDGGDVCAQALGRGVPGPPRAQLRGALHRAGRARWLEPTEAGPGLARCARGLSYRPARREPGVPAASSPRRVRYRQHCRPGRSLGAPYSEHRVQLNGRLAVTCTDFFESERLFWFISNRPRQ